MCGISGWKKDKDIFIDSLCDFSIPKHKSLPTEKNIFACKTLLNIAHCLPNILDSDSWGTIFSSMQKIESILCEKLN